MTVRYIVQVYRGLAREMVFAQMIADFEFAKRDPRVVSVNPVMPEDGYTSMHDFDLPQAYLKVESDDPTAGELGVVVRDAHGGVSWKIWPIHAE